MAGFRLGFGMQYELKYQVSTTPNGPLFDVDLFITVESKENPNEPGAYKITDISGTWNGQKVLGLNPLNAPNAEYDNYFIPSGTNGFANPRGFDFRVDTSAKGSIAGDDGQGNVNFGSLNGINYEYRYPKNVPITFQGITVACFCTGTRIETGRGSVRVEDLAIGDLVLTASGRSRPVRWIGRRSYSGRFAAGNPDVWPVLIRAGALDDNVPHNDLRVSPKHALLLDGVLVPAVALVNGCTILQTRGGPTIEYVHIELDEHDVIYAEGAPAETFVDDESRSMFHNYGEYVALYGEPAPSEAIYCAPRKDEGVEIDAIRRRLALRAAAAEVLAA